MPEEQELKLTVTLDDKASEQLQQLLQTMNSLGGSSGSGTAGLNQFAQALRGASGHAQGLQGGLMGMAAKGGFIAGFFLEIGRGVQQTAKELANAVLNVREYAEAMVSLEQAASRSATTAAQFQRNIAAMRESGISAEAARKNWQGFSDTLADLQREQSKTRASLLGGLYGLYREDMQGLIQRVSSAGSQQQAFNEVVKFARQVREFHTSQGRANLGAVAEKELLERWNIPDADKMREDLENVTPELEALYKRRMDNAERFQTATAKTADATDRGIRSIQASALYMLPLTEAMEGFAEIVGGITKALQLWENLVGGTDTGSADALPGQGQNPDVPATPGAPATPAGPTTQRLPLPSAPAPYGRDRRGRPYPAPQQLLGDGGGDGGGDEDHRTSLISNTDQVKSVTEQLKRLNDYFELQSFKGGKLGLLSQPGTGRAGIPGGVAPGTTSGPTGTTPGGTNPNTGTTNPPAAPQWPEPSAGNVMPPGFGGEGGIGGVEGIEGASPWAATVGRGGVYAGQQFPTPPGWGPGGSGQPWGTTGATMGGAGPAAGGGGGGGDLDRGAYDRMFKGTPLEGQYDTVVREAAKNNVPASVMAGIISFETGKGTSKMVRERLNPAGLMDPKTGMQKGQTFKTIEEGIAAAGRTIGKRYGEAGGDLQQMGKVYAPVGARNDPNQTNVQWPGGVSRAAQQLAAPGQQNPPASPNQKVASTDPNAPISVNGKLIPAEIEAGARQAAIAGGSRGLQRYYESKGIRLDDQWCGNHAAIILKSRGYQVPQNPQLASNWNRVTELGWSEVRDPREGDIAVARPGWSRRGSGRTGEVGSHVTTVEEGIDKGGRFKSFGGNQGEPFRNFNARSFRFYRPPGSVNPAAPATAGQQGSSGAVPYLLPGNTAIPSDIIDRSATQKVSVKGAGTVDVSVKTEPQGAASKKDLVKPTPIPRKAQMTPAPTDTSHDAELDS